MADLDMGPRVIHATLPSLTVGSGSPTGTITVTPPIPRSIEVHAPTLRPSKAPVPNATQDVVVLGRGPQGPTGPMGPAGGDLDLIDLAVVFENGLI